MKKYSRPLDLLLAAVESHRKGDVALAGRFFVRAASHKEVEAMLNELDALNTKAATADVQMAKAIKKAQASLIVKADEDFDADSDLDLEESADEDKEEEKAEDKEEEKEESDADGSEDDLDSLLDDMDGEEEESGLEDGPGDSQHRDAPDGPAVKEAETTAKAKAKSEKAGEHGDQSKMGEPDDLHEETPKPDKNEPASTAKAKAEAKKEEAKKESKKQVKASDERVQRAIRNQRILARLAATQPKAKK